MSAESLLSYYVVGEESYPDKAVIIEEGGKSHWVYLILEGQVKVTKMTKKGMVNVDILKEGDIFGEMVLLKTSRGVRTASIVASGPVRVGVLDVDRLSRDYDRIHPLLRTLITSLNRQLEDITRIVAVTAVEVGSP